ncbi:hypothetical protein CLIB1444_01S03796 [[Candida] jaroonii]|uniref:Uncharacterized protein n=1 Tax=[Candida] jaroonii TaxID=467808 RepID=A0ACA9Y065_9ASCO|nr:hypothetical protein CLIB1444_01S03796 [[Candida] jaroonii]
MSVSPIPTKNCVASNHMSKRDYLESIGSSSKSNFHNLNFESTISSEGSSSDSLRFNVPENSSKFPSIEEFLNDCFLHSMNELNNLNRIQLIKDFEKYIVSLHSQENLKFLISIYNYEHYYNKIFKSINKLNTTSSMRKTSVSTLLSSKNSDYNDTSNYFASTIDDLKVENEEYWESFKMNNVSDDDIESVDDISDSDINSINSIINIDDQILLTKKWNTILNNFIHHDSKYQINLSGNCLNELLHQKNSFPDPSVLLKAKEEILQLLNENAYHPFIKKIKSCKDTTKVEICTNCHCLDESISPKSLSPKLRDFTSPILSPSVSSTNSSLKKKKANFWNHLRLNNSMSNSGSSLSSTPDDDKSKFKLWKKK